MRVKANRGSVTDEAARELARLGYVVGEGVYTIDDKKGGYELVGIQETATAHGVKIWLLLSGGDLKDGATYCAPIGRVDRVSAQAVA